MYVAVCHCQSLKLFVKPAAEGGGNDGDSFWETALVLLDSSNIVELPQ